MLIIQNVLIDFNSFVCYFGASTKGATNEHRQNCFFTSHGILASIRIPQMRRALSRRLQSKKFFVHGSILMHGFRTTNLPRKSARHRIVSSFHAEQTLSHGYSWTSFAQHPVKRKQPKRLAYLRGLCPSINSYSQKLVSSRSIWRRDGKYCLRVGCHNDRSVPLVISLGLFSKEQRSYQASHASGFTRQHPVIYRDYRRKNPRSQHIGYAYPRSRVILHHGSRLSRFRTALCLASSQRLFYHQSQVELPMPPTLFAAGQQNNRLTMRSNSCFNRLSINERLPGKTSTRKVFRFRARSSPDIFNQQFFFRSFNDSRTLQIPLENRTLFQMDQATPPYQNILRDIRERCQNSSLDRDFDLRVSRDYQKTFNIKTESLHNSTNFQRDYIRENAYFSSTYRN